MGFKKIDHNLGFTGLALVCSMKKQESQFTLLNAFSERLLESYLFYLTIQNLFNEEPLKMCFILKQFNGAGP